MTRFPIFDSSFHEEADPTRDGVERRRVLRFRRRFFSIIPNEGAFVESLPPSFVEKKTSSAFREQKNVFFSLF